MNISNIQKSQQEYYDLIKSFENSISSENITQYEIIMMLDEVQSFWLNKKNILNIELDDLVSQKDCVMLSGAIYLNIKDNEHYMFKSLGEEHIIPDPLLKLEYFFRIPSDIFNVESIEIFRRAFSDALNILSKTNNYFFILPIKLMVIEDEKENIELLQKFFLNFINSSFNENFNELNEFFDHCLSYEEIEKKMNPFIKSNLTFDENDNKLSLEEKIESYLNTQDIMKSLTKDKIESEKFILALRNYVTQIIDILIMALKSGLIPFIRYKPTFQYLTIVMYTFIEDKYFKDMIEKTIVYYIFYNTVNKENLTQIDFNKFVSFVHKKQFLNVIIQEMKREEIDIFKGGVNEVNKIIENKFCLEIEKLIQPFKDGEV